MSINNILRLVIRNNTTHYPLLLTPQSPVTSHLSPVTSPQSPVTSHQSPPHLLDRKFLI
ncbi:hypothetical protein IQ227_20515 [Anabaena aphanizomenioides LEGE 00250]|uniref:Uncharacterized protein n=1 Tax=Sphaerospermopsis aphanizomenoides LEGE 00250 TaxID=2777972 RepID=A0ABR9VIK2_9CYAN|nr:hypothetical protein [Sphaerospermopsis aphanizomenoides LEGE 00250]